ncbi:anti-sigma factor [Paracoccus caeni]|uniref:Anti-sigma factor n=1 Tax=Paracoccus caeni TaxID=657651 RepID=A0A934VV95_9RHOB|nr:anti-sigma factor [Paracoccus caeni]MBK4216691.1 anti-sigma factor [Paracoccus caeni]
MLNEDPAMHELDLCAYIDDQLTETQKAEVEAWLSHHPEASAQVMRDLAMRRDLRRALMPPAASAPLLGAARALARARRRAVRMRAALRLVPAVLLIGLGWLANAGLGPLSVGPVTASQPAPPSVTSALAAHQVSTIRLAMLSQPETTQLDEEELRAATGIILPHFPEDWTVRDVQVFPSAEGPGIEILFDSAELGRVSHFAVRAGAFNVTMPRLHETPDYGIAWFQIGETAHVLVAEDEHADTLLDASFALSDTLY